MKLLAFPKNELHFLPVYFYRPPTNISGFLFACVTGSRWFEIPCKDPVIRFGHSMVIVDGDIFVYGGFRSCQDKSAGKLEKIVIEDLPAL